MIWTWLLIIIYFRGLQSHPYGPIILKELLETWEDAQVFIYTKESTETTAWAGTLLTPQLVLTSNACCVTNLEKLWISKKLPSFSSIVVVSSNNTVVVVPSGINVVIVVSTLIVDVILGSSVAGSP
jgi:hypothetical protein